MGVPKTAVILVSLVLWAPLVFCRNVTGPATLTNATVSPVKQHQPSTIPATTVTSEASTSAGSWFFWRRSVDGNGTVPVTEAPAPGSAANLSTNTTGTPVAESLVTRSAGASTPEPTSTVGTDESSQSTSASAQPEAYVAEALPAHSDCSNGTAEPTSTASTDAVRDLSGTNAETNATSNATGSTTTFQTMDVRSVTEVPVTSSTPEVAEVTSDGSCHCHDTATPSTSAQSVTVQQQAHVTHPPADATSATSVPPTPTGRRPVREPQNPPQTTTSTTTTAPDYVV